MKKLVIANPEETRFAILEQMARSEESRFDLRMHAILLVISGGTCQQVAELFGEDLRTIQRWVKRYKMDGLNGLREGKHPGRPASLVQDQWARLVRDTKSSPVKFGQTSRSWNTKSLAEYLRENHAVELGIRQCQRILKLLYPKVYMRRR